MHYEHYCVARGMDNSAVILNVGDLKAGNRYCISYSSRIRLRNTNCILTWEAMIMPRELKRERVDQHKVLRTYIIINTQALKKT